MFTSHEEPVRQREVACGGESPPESKEPTNTGAPMNNRIPLLVGGAVLIVVGSIGSFWVLTAEAPAAPVVTVPAPTGMAYADELSADAPRDPIPIDQAKPIEMTVYLSPTCGCCSGWVEHIKEYGFEVSLEYRVDLTMVKQGFGVRPELSSCHTAVVNGYIIEGHVPGDVVRQFLADAPAVRGLSVPGMPMGSPGMEMGGRVDSYDVLTFTSTGQTEVYSQQGRG